jgi:PPE-repeat protein
MDFGALMPEINSARMYAGPGSGPMLAAAAGWAALAAELRSAASFYQSVIEELANGWLGPSSMAMAAAATPYAAWLSATAAQAELTATSAHAAAGAFEAAFAMTVPPPVIAENRAQLAMLVATNFLGQNTPAIAATEAHYGEMWAQDATAMYGYAANSAATTAMVKPFTAAPQTTNPAGLAAQSAAGAQAAGTSTGTGVQSTLSQLVSAVPTTLANLASPAASASTGTGPLGGLSSSLSGFSLGSVASGLMVEYGAIPGWFTMFLGSDALQPLMASPMNMAFNAGAAGAAGAAGEAAGAAAAEGALGSGLAGGLGGLGGLGQAAAVGGLSVPASWGWASAAPAAMMGGVPLASPLPLPGSGFGSGLGAPLIFGGLPRAAAAGEGGGAAAVAKYGPRLNVVARSPAAGYAPGPPTPLYPVPAPGLTPPAPGYTPAIVYLPTNGHAPSLV